ncbi:MAG: hypothetical protein M3P23_00825 [Actinomycetota bacterium]|nr:hypothetical protein [Actinomycetota bacterium]
MKLYADLPIRRTGQVLLDLLVLVWVVVWVRAGMSLHDATLRLAAPGRQMESAGLGLSSNLRSASDQVDGVPLVGDKLRAPFDAAGRAAGQLTAAGREQQSAVGHLAVVLGICIAVIPILIVVALWLPRRVRFARLAGAAQRFVDADADLDLFALRAMAVQPMHVLARVSPDPVGAWRRGDRAVVRSLAMLELRDAGLRPPA